MSVPNLSIYLCLIFDTKVISNCGLISILICLISLAFVSVVCMYALESFVKFFFYFMFLLMEFMFVVSPKWSLNEFYFSHFFATLFFSGGSFLIYFYDVPEWSLKFYFNVTLHFLNIRRKPGKYSNCLGHQEHIYYSSDRNSD